MANPFILCSIIFSLVSSLSHSQIVHRSNYHTRVDIGKKIEERATQELKVTRQYDASNNLMSETEYNNQGNIIRFISYNLEVNSSNSKAYLELGLTRPLTNEWNYQFDVSGNIIKAENKHEYIKSTAHGGNGAFSQPYMACPCSLEILKQLAEWQYQYDNEGRMIEKIGFVSRSPEWYHTTNSMASIDAAEKWRITFMYNEKGLLIEEKEYYPHTNKKPIKVRTIRYDPENNIIQEKLGEGESISNQINFTYSQENRLLERYNGRSTYKYVYNYNNEGLVSQIEQYTNLKPGYLTLTHHFQYNQQGLLVKEWFVGMKQHHGQINVSYQYEYDNVGRPLKKFKNAENTNNRLLSYSYEYFPTTSSQVDSSQVEKSLNSAAKEDSVTEDMESSVYTHIHKAKYKPSSIWNDKWGLIGFENNGTVDTITCLQERITIKLKDEEFELEDNAYWCEFTSGSDCFDSPMCWSYSYVDEIFRFNHAQINHNHEEKLEPQHESRCFVGLKSICDPSLQPQQEHDLIRRHTIALYNDDKEIILKDDKIYLVSKSGKKETIIYKRLDLIESALPPKIHFSDTIYVCGQEHDNTIWEHPDITPRYPDGFDAMHEFIQSNINHSGHNFKSGKYFVEVIVKKDGSVSIKKPLTEINSALFSEFVRVFELMPNWLPGRNSNVRVLDGPIADIEPGVVEINTCDSWLVNSSNIIPIRLEKN